jgi:glycine/D-amino acid oxidase-like deaminating enzyme
MKYKTGPWDRDIERKSYPDFKGDTEADVVIIGGGITGILNGYTLSKENLKVIILEKDKLCYGATSLTTAFLTALIDTDTKDLIKAFGQKDARLILESHQEAIDFIENIIKKEKIECEFKRCSNYLYINSIDDEKILEKEHQSLKKLGVKNNFSESPKEGFHNLGFLEIPNQAKFHPLKFALSLAEISEKNGVEIFEGTEVKEVRKDDKFKKVVTKKGSIKSKWVLSCTYKPFGEPLNLYFKKGMYTTYMQEYEIPKNIIEEGTYEDTENPYHYFRIDPKQDYDRLIIGGEDNKIIVPVKEDRQLNALKKYVDKILPDLEKNLVYKWSGPILEPGDALAFIGESSDPNMLYAMAFSGNGMTYAGISALIIRDIIKGKENPYYDLYRTNRILRPKAAGIKAIDYLEEFVNGVFKNKN